MEKIALVDDDPDILEVFTQFIAFFGYSPLPFQDPQEALKKIPAENPAPALILLDLVMTPIDRAPVSGGAPKEPAARFCSGDNRFGMGAWRAGS